MIIHFDLQESFTARSVSVRPMEHPILADLVFQVQDSSGTNQTITRTEMNRSKPDLNVGFEPYAPVVLAFQPVNGHSYRLIIKTHKRKTRNGYKEIYPESGIAEVEIFASPRVERAAEKSLAKMHSTPLPYWDAYLWKRPAEVDDRSMVVDGSKVIDITRFMTKDGRLEWRVPAGD